MAKMSDNRVTKEDRDRIKSYADRKAAHERAQKARKRTNRIIVGSISGVVVIALGIGIYSAVVSVVAPAPEITSTPTATGAARPDGRAPAYDDVQLPDLSQLPGRAVGNYSRTAANVWRLSCSTLL